MQIRSLFKVLICAGAASLAMWITPISNSLAQSISELFQQGNAAQERGEYERAESIWQQLIQQEPENAIAHYNLGNALRDQGNLEEAIASFERAIQIDPDYAQAHNNLGNVLSVQGNLEDAIASFQRAIQIIPNVAIPHNNLGIALRKQGNLEEAIASYGRALQINPDYATAHNNLGFALKEQGNLEEAISAYQRALELDPYYATAQNNLLEAERLLAASQVPLPISDLAWLPDNDPLLQELRATVRVVATLRGGDTLSGTGWVIKRDDNTIWVLTNRHVVSETEGLKEVSTDISVEYFSNPPAGQVHLRQSAELVRITDPDNEELDLALLKISNPPDDVQALEFIDAPVARGTSVIVLGHPVFGFPWSVENGSISNLTSEKLQISQAVIAVGNSGGPVLDSENRVVGMIVETITPDESSGAVGNAGFGFAYTMPYILEQLEDWNMF